MSSPKHLSILGFITRRLVMSIPLIFGIITANFVIIHLAPGDPVSMIYSGNADPSFIMEMREKWGFNEPLITQFIKYIVNVFKGDLGYSFYYRASVLQIIIERIGPTLLLVGLSLAFASIFGIIIGMWSARKPHSLEDNFLTVLTIAGYSIPSFWFGQLLIIIFAVQLKILPVGGMTASRGSVNPVFDIIYHLVLPVLTLAITNIALISRLTRANMIEALSQDYVIGARARGLSEKAVFFKHALRNALPPIMIVVGQRFGMILAGAVLVEIVFSWPGLGRLMIDAMNYRDYPVILAMFFFISIMVIMLNLLTDILHAYFEPRVRFEKSNHLGIGSIKSKIKRIRWPRFSIKLPKVRFDKKFKINIEFRKNIKNFWWHYRGNKTAVIALVIFVLFVILATLASVIAPNPTRLGVGKSLQPPSLAFLMGTDDLGRDMLRSFLHGARVSLLVGFCAALTSATIGTVIGAVSGYFGGITDELLMRTTEFFMVIPGFFLAILVATVLGPNILGIILIIGGLTWPRIARVVRGEFLSLRKREYVEAARLLGMSKIRIIFTEILPNALNSIIVLTTLNIAAAIIVETGISFLGLGDPTYPSWGVMLRASQEFMRVAWWLPLFPGVGLFLAVLSINLNGDGLSNVYNPRTRISRF